MRPFEGLPHVSVGGRRYSSITHVRVRNQRKVDEMAHIQDVAAYILGRRGSMTAMKLQKLCYYAQAWSLVWEEEPLFPERIEAWANGPVAPALYRLHSGKFTVDSNLEGLGDEDVLTDDQRETVDAILEHYGKKSAAALSDLTHREEPWKSARGELAAGERSREEITPAAMAEYYGALYADAEE